MPGMDATPAPRASGRFADKVGRASPSLAVEVEKGHVRRFVEAIGDPDPLYREEAAARAAGYEHIPAPPTFPTALRPNDVREGLGIDMRKVLHGEQEFAFRRPVLVGDRLTLVQRLAEAYEKSGRSGMMDFLVLETLATDEAGQWVYRARATIVVKR